MRFTLPPAGMLSLLLLLGACSGSGPGSAATDPALASPSASEGVTAFLGEVLGGRTTLTYAGLVERLGPPVRVRAEALAGASETAQADTLRTVVYHGLEVILHEASSSKASYVARLALTDARHTSPDGLRVGYAREHILQALGRPTRQTAGELFYEQTDPRPLLTVLFLEHRAVSRIEWRLDH